MWNQEEFLDRVQQLADERNLSLKAVTREVDINPGSFTDWKKGRGTPTIAKVCKLAEFFGVSLDFLVYGSESRSPVRTDFSTQIEKSDKMDTIFIETYKKQPSDIKRRLQGYLDAISSPINFQEDSMLTKSNHTNSDKYKPYISLTDFQEWAFPQFINESQRSLLAEYIVASAIGPVNETIDKRFMQSRPYDFLTPEGLRVEVRYASYLQLTDINHPDRITYTLEQALQRNSDVHVFTLFKATSPNQDPLDLNLWEFYILSTNVLDIEHPVENTITLPTLMQLAPVYCTYESLKASINLAMQREA